MSFSIKPSSRIKKQIRKLSNTQKRKISSLLVKLKTKPVPIDEYNVMKIRGSDNSYRIRIQTVRIIYDVYWKEKRIDLLKIQKRKDRTYKKLN